MTNFFAQSQTSGLGILANRHLLLTNKAIMFVLQMAEQAKAQMQQTVARLTDTCWDKCIGTPGGSSWQELSWHGDCSGSLSDLLNQTCHANI